MSHNSMNVLIDLKVGDTIEVNGTRFLIRGFSEELNEHGDGLDSYLDVVSVKRYVAENVKGE